MKVAAPFGLKNSEAGELEMTPSVPAVVAGRSKVGLAIVRALAVRGVACKGSAVASLSDPMPALSPLQAGLGGALKQRRPAAQGGIAQA